MKLRFWLLPER